MSRHPDSGYLQAVSATHLIAIWRRQREGRIPAGSSARPMVALRAELQRRELWSEIYR